MKERTLSVAVARRELRLRRTLLLSLFAMLLAALAATFLVAASRPEPPAGSSWHEGAEGFIEALDEAMAEKKPLAVYFYTDWCGYCRQLERELLFTDEVTTYLGENLTTVRINPERGQQENEIAKRYGVYGYPSLFLHAGPGHDAEKVSGRVKRDGSWQMQTTDEFIETVNGIIGRSR